MTKKRSTCIVCRKKRYHKYMSKVIFIKTNVYYNERNIHWCCNSCLVEYKNKVSDLVVQFDALKSLLQKTIKKVTNENV